MDSSLITSCRSLVTQSPKWPLRKSVAVLRRGGGKSQAAAQLSSFGGTLPRVTRARPGLYHRRPAGVSSVLSLAGMQRRIPLIRSESSGSIPISRGNPCQVSAYLSYGTREGFLGCLGFCCRLIWFGFSQVLLTSIVLLTAESGIKCHPLQVRLRGFSTELTSYSNDPNRPANSCHPRPLCHHHHQHAHGGTDPQAVLRQIQRAHFFR